MGVEAVSEMPQDDLLSPIITSRCFWWPHCRTEITDRPQAVHSSMEEHYEKDHQADMERLGFK